MTLGKSRFSCLARHCAALAVTLSAGSAVTAAEVSDAEVAALGEAQYNQLCAACHNGALLEAPRIQALSLFEPGRIVESLESGVMSVQGMPLSREQKRQIAFFITGRKHSDDLLSTASFSCRPTLNTPVSFASAAGWSGWGGDQSNTRHQSVGAGLSAENVGSLELQWVFAVPGATRSRAQPIVTDELVFVGSQQGVVYALDASNGCPVWTYGAEAEVRGSLFLEAGEDGLPQTLYFGDFNANVYAVDAASGELKWKTEAHEHPRATITGSVTAYDGVVIVPVSSSEIILASRNEYSCCSFRGAVTALDAATGKLRWRTYTTDEPRPTILNNHGVQQYGPSGAPVWSGPTIDPERGLVYAATGENYSSPATDTSDSVIALSLYSGNIEWVTQLTANDAWNGACSTGGANCPEERGPDYDIGASVIIVKDSAGQDHLLVGQKSGLVYSLDPNDGGKERWRQRVGSGGTMGGVHWGMASDGEALFVGISDLPTKNPGNVGDPHPGMHALDVATGEFRWRQDLPRECEPSPFLCWQGVSAAVSSAGDLVFGGGLDGLLRAYDKRSGEILWTTNTRRDFGTHNGIKATGGSIEADGPVIAGGRVYITSGYEKWGEAPGNVLLVYGLPE